MKFKLDENLDTRLSETFSAAGHDVQTVLSEGLSGAADETVFRAAVAEARTLVTLDLDFSNPVRFSTRATAGIVVIRVSRPVLSVITAVVRAALPHMTGEKLAGKLWIVEPGRIREHAPDEPID